MTPQEESTKSSMAVRAPELSERVNVQLLTGTKGALEDMARREGFTGRYCVAEFIRGCMEARIKADDIEAYRRIKGAA